MATFNEADAGKFRANENASQHNNINLVDPDTPGTVEQDNGTAVTTAATKFEGITYTGKDGVSQFISFFREERPDGAVHDYDVQVSDGRDALRDALLAVLKKHEVDPIVTVTGTADNFDIRHVGAGEVESVSMDGAAQALVRTAL